MDMTKRILIVEDEKPLRNLFHKRLARKGALVDSFSSAEEALAVLDRSTYDIALVDIKLPNMDGIEFLKRMKELDGNSEVIIITGHGTIDSAIAAMKLGAYDYLTKPCKLNELEVAVQRAFEKKTLREANINLRDELRLKNNYGEIIGRSEKMRQLMRLVKKVAGSNSTVLIEGETGTGKELIAHEIHRRSARRDESFIVVHCSALPETLQESELFGYEKGAFTGAFKQKRGLVELANRGTLFIDEVGEMNTSLQVKLLRFIETSKFRRLGGGQERQLDIRIIAATNRDLQNALKEGRFRKDLYYRLGVAKIHLPPLREKKEDLPLLAKYFLDKTLTKKRMPRAVLDAFMGYDWPGNVRELINAIEMATIMSSGKNITIADFPFLTTFNQKEQIRTLAEMEKEHIAHALSLTAGNKTRAAKMLGISLRNLYRKIERYELN
jgi:DNA-binding NtrC family response regulator